MKKSIKICLGILAVLLVLFIGIYVLLGLYYTTGFPCFTWINGIYATGKSVEEVNEELLAKDNYTGIVVMDRSGARLLIDASDIDLSCDYTQSLKELFDNNNPLLWGIYALESGSKEFLPDITLDEDKLFTLLDGWEVFTSPDDYTLQISRTTKGYQLINDVVSIPDKEAVKSHVYGAALNKESVIDLSLFDDCYNEYDLTENEKDKVSLFSKIDKVQSVNITYEIGDGAVELDKLSAALFMLTGSDIEDALIEESNNKEPGKGLFIIDGAEYDGLKDEDVHVIEDIAVTENGDPIISEKKVYDFLYKAVGDYSTEWMLDRYLEGLGNSIAINENGRGDGTIYDIDAEFEHLKNIFLGAEDNTENVREFALSDNTVIIDGKKDLGDTFIRIDMGNQLLTYYVDGDINMQFPIVTGNINRGRGTPAGYFTIYNKRYHTYLRGADYVSYVNYWLGVNKGVGIHDATWRSKFGQEIYKSDGSHGCINCPLDKAEELWNIVEVGTPVILFY